MAAAADVAPQMAAAYVVVKITSYAMDATGGDPCYDNIACNKTDGADNKGSAPGIGHNNPPQDDKSSGKQTQVSSGGGCEDEECINSGPQKPEGIPEDWVEKTSKFGGGKIWQDPENPGNSVRVMPGNPNSPFPNSQAPYVRWQLNGQPLDQLGKILPTRSVPEAHIPVENFRFLPELFK
jgi:hypothetical protein